MVDEKTPSQHDPDTIQLVERCLHGEQEAYRLLYEGYAPGAYRLCLGLLLNEQDAEDILQDTFVYAFRNLARYDSARASFRTWLFMIAVSRCRNNYRHKHFPAIDWGSLWPVEPAAPQRDMPEPALAHQAARDAVGQALRSLSPILREAVILRYGHGLTYREIADVMQCPQKTAESRVRLAHDQLRRTLHQVGPGLLDEFLRMEA